MTSCQNIDDRVGFFFFSPSKNPYPSRTNLSSHVRFHPYSFPTSFTYLFWQKSPLHVNSSTCHVMFIGSDRHAVQCCSCSCICITDQLSLPALMRLQILAKHSAPSSAQSLLSSSEICTFPIFPNSCLEASLLLQNTRCQSEQHSCNAQLPRMQSGEEFNWRIPCDWQKSLTGNKTWTFLCRQLNHTSGVLRERGDYEAKKGVDEERDLTDERGKKTLTLQLTGAKTRPVALRCTL